MRSESAAEATGWGAPASAPRPPHLPDPLHPSLSNNHKTKTLSDESTAPTSKRAERLELCVAPGDNVQHYEIIRALARGGMGEVFLARDTRLGRLVAVKFLTRVSSQNTARFLVEARATAQLSHENIVIIHDLGEHRGTPYIVLEYLKGQTLRQWLDDRRSRSREEDRGRALTAESAPIGLPPSRAVEIILPVVRALVCAHENGVVHRDLKPSNVMLTDTSAVKVLDFSIAKILGDPERDRRDSGESREDAGPAEPERSELTKVGALLGTGPYMSPEQWGSGCVDHRADIWAVGIILAELVLGRHPLAPLFITTLRSIADLDAPMPSLREARPDLGKLASIIDRCLIKRKEDRISRAHDLLAELESLAPLSRQRTADEDARPFAGLSALKESDAARFFGRSRAVTEVLARLSEQPLIAIIGASGAGKSSFVRAGVIPALERGGDAWEAFTLRPGPRPLAALAELLLAHSWLISSQSSASAPDEALAHGAEGRDDLIQKLSAEPGLLGTKLRARARRRLQRILLFIDQLEELYTLAEESERAAFFACLAGVADDIGSPLRVVLAIRSDFVDRVAEAHAAMTGLSRGIMLLSPMDREGLREALVRPLEDLDVRFESRALVEEMLDTLEHSKGALPLLQFTAAKLWEDRDRERRVLTEASYRRIGGVGGTLAGHADAVMSSMVKSERKLTRAIFLRLITPERTRALATLGELREFSLASSEINRVLERLIDARLLTVESSRDADAMVEIVHESLITSWPTLSRWIRDNQEDAAFIARLRHTAREWRDSGEAEGLLWRGQAAHDARRWHARYSGELAQTEERYLRAVFALAERSRRQRRAALIGGFATLLMFAAGMSYLAWQKSAANRTAERAAETARSEAERARAEAERAHTEAIRARDAIRMAVAREHQEDPTTVVALLREIEGPKPPRGFPELIKRALDAGVARAVLLGHDEPVPSAAWSPDGARVVSASFDKTVRVWSADGLGDPVVLEGHADIVASAVFSPDGARVASASSDKTVRVWSADGSGRPLVLSGHSDAVRAVAFSPDGSRLASASLDKTVRVWSLDGSRPPLVFEGHAGPVLSAAWSPDGTRVVSASADKTLRVFRADGRGAPLIIEAHDDTARTAAFSPDGSRIVSASLDKTIKVWSADGSGEARVFRGHESGVISAAWSPDGARIVSASWDKTARIWNADGSGSPVVLKGHSDTLLSAAWSPDGSSVVTASFDKSVRVWDAGAHDAPLVYKGHSDLVCSAAWSPDDARIASASYDKTVHVWSADGSGAPTILKGHTGPISWAAISPDGARVASASGDKTVRLWSADGSGDPVVLKGHADAVTFAEMSPDGSRVVSSSNDKTVRVWRADGSGDPLVLRGHTDSVWSAAWSPDGARIVSASWDKTVRIWNADGSGAPLVLSGHSDRVSWATWSPDGSRIVSASHDKTVRVWSADGSGIPLVLEGHSDFVYRAMWSSKGSRLASAGHDKTVRVWSNLQPVEPNDPRLWTATTYCLPLAERLRLLGVSEELGRAQDEQCRRRVRQAAEEGEKAGQRQARER